jgi:hypothetical protein
MPVHPRPKITCPRIVTLFGLTALAVAQPRPLDNIASRQYQHEIRPFGSLLTAGCKRWGFKTFGLKIPIRFPANSVICWVANVDLEKFLAAGVPARV